MAQHSLMHEGVKLDGFSTQLKDIVLGDFLARPHPRNRIAVKRRYKKALLVQKMMDRIQKQPGTDGGRQSTSKGRAKARALSPTRAFVGGQYRRNRSPTRQHKPKPVVASSNLPGTSNTVNGASLKSMALLLDSQAQQEHVAKEMAFLTTLVVDDSIAYENVVMLFRQMFSDQFTVEERLRDRVLFNDVLWRNIAKYLSKRDMHTLHAVIPFTAPSEINWFYSNKSVADQVARAAERKVGASLRNARIYDRAIQRRYRWPTHELHRVSDDVFIERIIEHDAMYKAVTAEVMMERETVLLNALNANHCGRTIHCIPPYKICADYILGCTFATLHEVVATAKLVETCFDDADEVFELKGMPVLEDMVFGNGFGWIEGANWLISDPAFCKQAEGHVEDWLRVDYEMVKMVMRLSSLSQEYFSRYAQRFVQ
jgi:hypothetical protein